MCLLVAPQWLQLFESCSLSSLSRSSSLAELASTACENMGVSEGYTIKGKRVCRALAHRNNCAMMCWWWPRPSGSLPSERKAAGVVACKLWFLPLQEFFSNGNRS